MVGKEHEADLECEALKWRRAAEVSTRARAGDPLQHGSLWPPIHDRARGAIRRLALRLGPLALAFVLLLLAAPSASAYERPPLLQTVAGYFALRPAEVRCPSMEEWVGDPIWGTSPNPARAWGYTDMINEHIVLHPALCAGAMAVSDSTLPLWQRATGTLVLVHETYHLRRWKWRRNEAKVECQCRTCAHGHALPRVPRPPVPTASLDIADDAIGVDTAPRLKRASGKPYPIRRRLDRLVPRGGLTAVSVEPPGTVARRGLGGLCRLRAAPHGER